MAIPIDERPLPGTNRNVYLYDRLQVAAVNYPNANVEDMETVFDSGFFFYDYLDSIEKFQLGVGELTQNGYKVKSRDPAIDENEIDPYHIPVDMMYETDVYIKIFEAWMLRLVQAGTAPGLSVVKRDNLGAFAPPDGQQANNIFYKKITNFRVPDPTSDIIAGFDLLDLQFPLLKETIESVTGRKNTVSNKQSNLDRMMFRHPLAHFPPLDYYNYLNEVVFYDPNQSQLSHMKLQSQYGPIVASQMYSAFRSRGKLITYADIIKPFGSNGYGVSIDFRPFGYNSFSVQPWWEYYTYKNYYLDEIWNAHYPNEYAEKIGGERTGNTIREYTISKFYSQEKYIIKNIFEVRDSWIHFWLRGGTIPLEQHMNNLMFNKIREVEAWYPIYLKFDNSDYARAIAMRIVGLIVTAIISYYTGGSAALIMSAITTVITQILPRFLARFPIDEDDQMLINMVFSMCLNQFSEQDKENKKHAAFTFMINNFLSVGEQRELDQTKITNIKNAMSSFDDNVTTRQKLILEMLARHKNERLNGAMEGAGSTASDDLSRQINIDHNTIWKADLAREIGSGNDALRFGSIALAAIAAYKLLK